MTIRTADGKGRVTLGSQFANQTVIVEEVDSTEVRVTLAEAVPKREVWLHKNPKAKASVLQGLAQAQAREAAKSPPNLDRDNALLKELRD